MLICKNLSLKFLISISFLLCLILASCSTATPSGTIKQLDSKSLYEIKKLGVCVKRSGGFTLVYAAGGATDAWHGPTIWVGAVELMGRYEVDRHSGSDMVSMLGDFDPKTHILEKLSDSLSQFQTINDLVNIETISPTVLKEKQIDTTLEVIIEVWGLRRSKDPGASEVSAVIDTKTKMVKAISGETIWEFNYFYLDSQQYLLEVFHSQPGLLEKVMMESANRVSERIVNEIRYSQY